MTIIRCNFESCFPLTATSSGAGGASIWTPARKATGRDCLDDLKAHFKDLLARALELLEYASEAAHGLTVRFKCFRFKNKPKGIV